MSLKRWCCVFVTAVLGSAAWQARAQPDAQVFFSAPTIRSVSVSPSGRWLASVVSPAGQRARLVVTDLDDKEPGRIVAQFSRLDVVGVQWVNDEWLVFSTDDVVNRDTEWDQRGAGLVAVSRNGERLRLLIKREWDTLFPPSGGSQPLEGNHELLALGEVGTNEVIIGERRLDGSNKFSHVVPFALDVATSARRSLIDKAPPDVRDWIFDSKARARVAVSAKDDKVRVHWRDLSSGEWRQLSEFDSLDTGYYPAYLDERDRLMVAYADESGFSSLGPLDLGKGKPSAEPLVTTPGFSSGIGFVRDRATGALKGLNLLTDARSQIWLDAGMKAAQSKVDAALQGRVNLLSCNRCDGEAPLVVYSYADRLAGEFLVFRPKTGTWQPVGQTRADIDPQRMARKQFYRIKARDGGDLPVWVTRPQETSGKRAAVVLVHGGPWVRGAEWEWDAESQFLASRGYVVIEPEFRGSTGYGVDHFRAGWKQWGRAMQDDVTDALRHAVKEGWVDPGRVCIAGASYGGYATLMGLAKDPDQYRCGVAWVAVSDPLLMFETHWSDVSREAKQYRMPQLIGDPVKDAEMLRSNSPLEQAARIKAPVLLAYGGRDRRVPIDHGQRMRTALTKAGNPPEWIVYDDEEHGFSRPENRVDFWRRVEAFLARHLK